MSAQAQAPVATAPERGQRKVRLGTVIADKMNKTVIVQVGTRRSAGACWKSWRRPSDPAGDAPPCRGQLRS